MMPCITVAPRLHTVAAAFAPSIVSHDRSCVGEARSVPCPVPVRSRPDCSGIRRIPRRAASPCDDAAQAGRNPVVSFDVAIVVHFGIAESHIGFVLANGPLSLTPRVVFFRTPSFASTARWSLKISKLVLRGNPAVRPLAVSSAGPRLVCIRSGGYPWNSRSTSRTDIPRACVNRGRSAGYRVCPERKFLQEPVASMKSRSIVRQRDKSR